MTETNEELAVLIRVEKAAAEEARALGDADQARQHERRLRESQLTLWLRLEPGIKRTAHSFRR